jgi:hypothetical protein
MLILLAEKLNRALVNKMDNAQLYNIRCTTFEGQVLVFPALSDKSSITTDIITCVPNMFMRYNANNIEILIDNYYTIDFDHVKASAEPWSVSIINGDSIRIIFART